MNNKLTTSKLFIIGFMLFALFFGAGNLIFPALLGLYAGGNVWQAVIGFCITGVTLPLLGVVAIGYSGSANLEELASRVSKSYGIFFTVALLLTIGPFFAIPRTGSVSYEMAITPIFGDDLVVKIIYAIIFFGITYWLAVTPSKIADNIGKYLTPMLLVVIIILVAMSFVHPIGSIGTAYNASSNLSDQYAKIPFFAGILQGYGTMDALASLVFAIIVVDAAKQFGAKSDKEVAVVTLKSGVIGVSLLALVYIFVARIGATAQTLFTLKEDVFYQGENVVSGATVLNNAATHFLGSFGSIVLGLIVFLACLTTSTGLVASCSEYFSKLLPQLSYKVLCIVFTLVSTIIYFSGLSAIINWSIPVLLFLYPLTIAIIFLAFTDKLFSGARIVYQTTIALTIIPALYDGISALSGATKLFSVPESIKSFFIETLPLAQYGLGWIVFLVIGFVLGIILSKTVVK